MSKANEAQSETFLIDQAIAWLKGRLPSTWTVECSRSDGSGYAAPMLTVQGGGCHRQVAVEARSSLSPREALNLLPRLAQTLQSMAGRAPVLIVAPWLSARTRELLAERQINYIDLTGNALFQLDNPAAYVETFGANRNPQPKSRGKAQLRGAKAARLIRALADVRPPYGVRELAAASGLTPGYASRLLDTLYRESLVERSSRGAIESVDVPGLLRRWADSYDVFKTNGATTFIAPAGVDDLLLAVGDRPDHPSTPVITGSIAASRLAPVTAPATLVAYCRGTSELAKTFELLPADEGANVILLEPFDPIVWERTSKEIGLRFAAVSQIAVDCLTGNGRMPAEGEALLEWMQADEEKWRLPGLESPPARDRS